MALIVSACAVGPEQSGATDLSEFFEGTVTVRQLEADEAGSYLVAATAAVHGDDGYVLRLEERFYPESKTSRFVVVQEGVEHRIGSASVAEMSLKIDRDGARVVAVDLTQRAAGNQPESYISELVPTDLTSRSALGRTCATLTVDYGNDSFSHVLSTCDARSIAVAGG